MQISRFQDEDTEDGVGGGMLHLDRKPGIGCSSGVRTWLECPHST